MKHNSRYPLKHLSIRVPWHDNAWQGTICNNPKANGACLVLKNCAENRDDEKEQSLCGRSIQDLDEEDFPACIGERATFMAPFSFYKGLNHPYIESSPSTHGHLKKTQVRFPAYAASAVPYFWMLKKNAPEQAAQYDLAYDEGREPVLDWAKNGKDNWVQEYGNQKALLNCFFEHLEAETSLVFFYAKQVPFVEESGRVVVGVGRINKIIPSEAYEGSNSRFAASYWEHMVLHSIRKNEKDGFLLPYHDALDYQAEHSNYDIADLAVVVPDDKRFEFSYASEHVGNDTAIRVLLECLSSLEKAEQLGIGENHARHIKWIHNEIAQLEKLRGHYPGMGSALCAFGIEKGHFVASEIINKLEDENENPWPLFERELQQPKEILSAEIASLIPDSSKIIYSRLRTKGSPRIGLLHLLSRFDITIEQATVLYVAEEREKKGVLRTEEEYLQNPYLIYEDLRHTLIPIALETIDLGIYLKTPPDDLLPTGLFLTDPMAANRLRALTIQQLELASLTGHTLLPQTEIIKQLRDLPITPSCPVNSDYFEITEEDFEGAIALVNTKNGERAYQLQRLAEAGEIIRTKINKRIKGKRLHVEADWQQVLNETLEQHTQGEPDQQELKAREEKVAALQELAESRFSVLIGPAGTGKTTLLTVLASHPAIENNGVLLLAPTGKARVRMEEVAKNVVVTAKTLAQFLVHYGRYNGELQQYLISEKYCEEQYDTVILDEASMLTEEMLATTIDCLKVVKRFILVGDHRQLAPIGAGRPFVDIIHHLRKDGIETEYPRVSTGYAELTIKRRQGGTSREDLQLADWFSGEILDPGADAIINQILTQPDGKYLRMVPWEHESDFEEAFMRILIEELELESIEDVKQFNLSLGSADGRYFNFQQAAQAAENWQILSPVREKLFGVRALNRKIHKQFRQDKIDYARSRYGKIPKPIGIEEIVYGDKVINLMNSRRQNVWPMDDSLQFVANGEIGMVIGQFKTKKHTFKGKPRNTEVEFTSQKGYKYTFRAKEFSEEGDSPLELAYALTVHKAQGSEFGKVFLVVPNPCFLLTREMLYTALTRQKEKVIMLFQGDVFDIKGFASPLRSDTLQRITNLFEAPEMVEVDGAYLEKNLIHQASDGILLRSKSELVIYQRLLDKGSSPRYEQKLVIKGVEKLPDFTIEDDDTGEVYYWEHCGMLYDPEYLQRWEAKYQWYIDNGILPLDQGGGENGTLIVTQDKPTTLQDGSTRGAISIKEIDVIIDQVFSL